MQLRVRGGKPLQGAAQVPPDKSIMHRALILSALGQGPALVRPYPEGADNLSTLTALQSLGVRIERREDGAWVRGVGDDRLGPLDRSLDDLVIDCGNSGTTLRFLAGLCASVPGLRVVLDGDASLRRRPMARLRPLEAMGARLESVMDTDRLRPPLRVTGAQLKGCETELEIASAQVKSALLLAGLFSDGPTQVTEPRMSRDHTERMLAWLGVPLRREVHSSGAHTVTVEPRPSPWVASALDVPPDLSSAAFLLAAAAVSRGALEVRTGVNPSRTGVLDALAFMNLNLRTVDEGTVGGEPVARVHADGGEGQLRGAVISGELTLRSLDELPVLAGVAAHAEGPTIVTDARELRVKESDRVEATAELLRAFGADVDVRPDGWAIAGGARLRPARVLSKGDHRIAMTGVVVALGIDGESAVEGAEVIEVSFPGFVEAIRGLGGDIEEA